jgi:hypothetical protein
MYLLYFSLFFDAIGVCGDDFHVVLATLPARLILTLEPLRIVIITWYYIFKLLFSLLACLSSFPHELITFYFILFENTPLSLSLSFFLFPFFLCIYSCRELHGRRSGMDSVIYCWF